MNRFFVNPHDIQQDTVTFDAKLSRQIQRVLRLKPGERCVVLDDQGMEMLVELFDYEGGSCTARILERRAALEPRTDLLMILSLSQREKFEWMLQKCTEVGAKEFLPMVTSRTLVQKPVEVNAKYERWQSIIKEAAEQSGRGRIPRLLPAVTFEEAVKISAASQRLCLIPWEGEVEKGIRETLQDKTQRAVAMMIGPEGGFPETEVAYAQSAGFKAVTLGQRILRMETAAVVAATLVLYELG